MIVVRYDGDLDASRPGLGGTATGLANGRKRLRLHYPDRHTTRLEQQGEQGVTTLRLLGEPC